MPKVKLVIINLLSIILFVKPVLSAGSQPKENCIDSEEYRKTYENSADNYDSLDGNETMRMIRLVEYVQVNLMNSKNIISALDILELKSNKVCALLTRLMQFADFIASISVECAVMQIELNEKKGYQTEKLAEFKAIEMQYKAAGGDSQVEQLRELTHVITELEERINEAIHKTQLKKEEQAASEAIQIQKKFECNRLDKVIADVTEVNVKLTELTSLDRPGANACLAAAERKRCGLEDQYYRQTSLLQTVEVSVSAASALSTRIEFLSEKTSRLMSARSKLVSIETECNRFPNLQPSIVAISNEMGIVKQKLDAKNLENENNSAKFVTKQEDVRILKKKLEELTEDLENANCLNIAKENQLSETSDLVKKERLNQKILSDRYLEKKGNIEASVDLAAKEILENYKKYSV